MTYTELIQGVYAGCAGFIQGSALVVLKIACVACIPWLIYKVVQMSTKG